MSKKVFVIGLDGGTFNVINPLIKEGKLPNIARIMEEGVYAYLDSTIPPLTPVAWPSMFTGKLPGKHGVFDFSLPTRNYNEKTKEIERKRVNSTFIKSKALWELLSEGGKRCIVIDVPLTYPPRRINGLMISRVMATQRMKVTYPKELYRKLTRRKLLYARKIEDNLPEEHTGLDEKAKKSLDISKYLQEILKDIDNKVRLIRYLNDNYAWDFFMAVFMESDRAGHGFWKDQRKVKKVYEKLDEAIGRIFSILPNNCLKFIVSDHGFKDIKGGFFLNEWLLKHGYVYKTFILDKKSKALFKNLNKFKEDFHKKPGKHMGRFKFKQKIDYEKSLAYLYSETSYGLRINLKGRDPEGVVEPEAYEPLRERLIRELKNINDPLNGERIFGDVLKKEDVIGRANDDYPACDIYLLPKNMDYLLKSLNNSNNIFKRGNGGFHRKEGIFFALGDEFKRNFNAQKLSIMDVTPTILHLMDVETPRDLDGRIRKEIFNETSDSYKRMIKFGKSSQKLTREERFSKKEEEKLKQSLKALGYIE